MKFAKVLFIILILLICISILCMCIRPSFNHQQEDMDTHIPSDEENIPSIINECDERLRNIPIVGVWEYEGKEIPYWKIVLSDNGDMVYYDKEEGQIKGTWEYNKEQDTLRIQVLDNFVYWDSYFFNQADFIVGNIDGIVQMDKETHTIDFEVFSYKEGDCDNPYRGINFFGWNFNKDK